MTDNGPWRSAAERREAMQATTTRAALEIKESASGANKHLSNIWFALLDLSTGQKVIVWSLWLLIAITGTIAWKLWHWP